MLPIGNNPPSHNKGALQSQINLLTNNNGNILNIVPKLHMPSLPLLKQPHFQQPIKDAIGQGAHQYESTRAHMMCQEVAYRRFVDLHEEFEDVFVEQGRHGLQAFLYYAF